MTREFHTRRPATRTRRIVTDINEVERRRSLRLTSSLSLGKGKSKGTYTCYSACSWIVTSEAPRYDTRSQRISQFYPHTHTFNPQSAWVIPAFAFPAIAGTHLPTPEGWKAELAWVAGYVVRQFTCPKAVTHPRTNRAQRRATALRFNALPLQ